MKESAAAKRRLIIVSAPAHVDPASALFSEGIDLEGDDELCLIETSGNVDVQILADPD